MFVKLLFPLLALLFGLFSFNDTVSIPEEIEGVDLNLSENEYAFTFFDLIEGEASIIQGFDGSTIMLNTGTKKSREELMQWLKLYGVKKINSLIITKMDNSYRDNLEWAISTYQIPEIVVGKTLYDKNKDFFDGFLETNVNVWAKATKEKFSEQIEFSVLCENDNPGTGMDLSINISGNALLYLTSSKYDNAGMENLAKTDIKLIKTNSTAMTTETAKHLDPQTIVLDTLPKGSQEKMVEELNENWIELYVLKKQGTITAKFTENTHEVYPIKNHLYHSD
jgi:competence protein ComEC